MGLRKKIKKIVKSNAKRMLKIEEELNDFKLDLNWNEENELIDERTRLETENDVLEDVLFL